jgi:hypothetical protein
VSTVRTATRTAVVGTSIVVPAALLATSLAGSTTPPSYDPPAPVGAVADLAGRTGGSALGLAGGTTGAATAMADGVLEDATGTATGIAGDAVDTATGIADPVVETALDTVDGALETVDRTLDGTIETVDRTLDRTVATVDRTLDGTLETVDRTVEAALALVEQGSAEVCPGVPVQTGVQLAPGDALALQSNPSLSTPRATLTMAGGVLDSVEIGTGEGVQVGAGADPRGMLPAVGRDLATATGVLPELEVALGPERLTTTSTLVTTAGTGGPLTVSLRSGGSGCTTVTWSISR